MIYETYNDSVIVTTIHETYNDLINRYKVSAQLIQRLFFLNRYNGSGRKIISSAVSEDLFYKRITTLTNGGCNLIYLAKSLLQKSLASHIQSERDNSRD
jgi:hypothetical protein